MEEILGLSFTNRSVAIAQINPNDEVGNGVSVHDVLYPFPFEFNMILNEQNVELLTDRIGHHVSNNFQGKFCAFSLPMYMAQIKRAALPADLDERIVQKHLQWEVENLSARELSEYKVIKLDHSFLFGTHQEYVFVLIQKKILQTIQKLAEKSALELKKVLLDFDTIHKYLTHFNLLDEQKNQIVFQIDAFYVTTLVYLNGLFYDYSLQPLTQNSEDKTFEEQVAAVISSEMERVKSVVAQLPQENQEFQVFTTRLLTDLLAKRLDEAGIKAGHLSLEKQLAKTGISSNNIEAYAVIL